MAKKKKETGTSDPPEKFEVALERLEKIVHDLEEGEQELDESLALFEEGVGLSRFCMKKLDEAQAKVEMLLKDPEGNLRRVSLDEGAGNEDEPAGEEG